MENYSAHYSDNAFWNLVAKHGRKLPFLFEILVMWNVMSDPETPVFVKGIVVAALGYVIFPFDLIPDFIPFVGWADDAAAVAAAYAQIQAHVKPRHIEDATRKLGR